MQCSFFNARVDVEECFKGLEAQTQVGEHIGLSGPDLLGYSLQARLRDRGKISPFC